MAQITYADKTYLNENASIPANNKVQDVDMNEIKSVVNTNDNNVGDLTTLATDVKTSVVGAINELKNAEIYSTSEVKTNEVWLDGSPIYKKTYTKTGTGNAARSESITVGSDSGTIKMFTKYEVLCTNSTSPAVSLMANYYNSGTDYFRVFTGNATTFNLRYYVNYTPVIYVTIYYTKN